MGRATGNVIFRDHWRNHLVEIIDNGDERSLYFGGNVLQSAMSLSVPHRLVLSYTRFMMAALLFVNPPKRTLLVGVGAGSLIRFLHYYFPTCIIDGVDYSSAILKLAHGYFNLPEAEQINLYCDDGNRFFDRKAASEYDLILIDAFDQQGMAPSIYCRDFYNQCRTHLTSSGIISLNMWSGDEEKMDRVRRELKQTFQSCLTLPVPERGNIICIAAEEPGLQKIMERDYTELSMMSEQFDINFRQIVKLFIRQNLGFKQRIARLFR